MSPHRAALITLVAALSVLGLTVPAHAVGGSAEAVSAAAYWTPERMRAAVPLDRIAVSAKKVRTVQSSAATAAPVVIAPAAYPSGGAAWTGGGAVVKTAGRVFFTYQGRDASCSGDAVTSANKSTVLTAGHCVKLDGAYHANWVFVPAYDNGAAPHGKWAARATFATPQWDAGEDIDYDIGAAVVGPLNGALLTDVVGGQGVAFNQPKAQNMYAFGYPAAAPYDGTKLIYCSGRTFSAFLSSGVGMTCDMTGGSSGGPWFQSFDEATGLGVQNSVNSYKISILPFWMFGPYFGADAQNLYNTAAAA
ncbi:trypsin-like serine peptidase [Actinokineospora iranica]|uniref:V8-like Glu-specific endopeptidase n=1 Tax=Actinokineospora iranica TaxID=1271860 RepID=A0A1G6KAU8_9PSEU|nr:peptidase [Actinokineospora iranica]SDC28083.1 hypothetical protein SAMN05216174_101807 [Actinokineospora iranica]